MPIKYCGCGVQLIRLEYEFNEDPTDYSMACPHCEPDAGGCPYCEDSLMCVEKDGKLQLSCENHCFFSPLKKKKGSKELTDILKIETPEQSKED